MAEKRKPGKSPSGRGRNYTPLREVVHCACRGLLRCRFSTPFRSLPNVCHWHTATVGAEPTSTGRCAPCGQRMISVDFQSAPIITGEKVSFAALHLSPALALPATPL